MASVLLRRRLWAGVSAQLRAWQQHDGFLSQHSARRISTAAAQLDSSEKDPSSDQWKSKALVDSASDHNVKEYMCIALDRPLIPDGMPRMHRTSNQGLLNHFKELENMGGAMQLGVFMRKPSATSESESASPSDADSPNGVFDEANNVQASDLCDVGTSAVVKTITWQPEGPGGAVQGQLVLQGVRRIRRTGVISEAPTLKLLCKPLRNEEYNSEAPEVKATHLELVQTIKEIFKLSPVYLEQLRYVRNADFVDFSRFADMLVSLVTGSKEDLQEYLELTNVPKKLIKALEILKKEIDIIQMQADISKRVEEKFNKDQKRYFLMEQLKHIQKELGLTKDEKSTLTQKFTERFAPHRDAAPEEARQVIDEEINKLRTLEPASSEFNVTRNYLDWLTSLPWGVHDAEIYDILHTKDTLDADHHGLQDVKDRILEFVAVGKLNGTVQGKILCLVGPPGVGKTSIGKSIAHSLGRKFFRFSVGGLSDVAEIKGHRRTYVGAMPGKMVQCLKQVKSSNPLVLIDELDKLGRGFQGDPASALLELLDPEQNNSFRDHYLDVPVDLSKVLFVCTANVTDTIPAPLLDRMEVIHISGYTADEKRAIARKYLEKQALESAAMPENAAKITDAAMDVLIEQYCRESGVRNLKKQLEKIYRKLALQIVESDKLHFEEVEEEEESATPDTTDASPSSSSDTLPTDQADTSLAEALTKDTPAPSSESSTDGTPQDETPSAPPSESPSEAGSASQQADAKKRMKPVYDGEPIEITDDNLDKYVGNPPFNSDRFYATTPSGVVMGLAWTSMGGSTLYVESNKVLSSGDAGLKLTGQLGDVMKESAMIAQTFSRAFLHRLLPDSEFLEKGTVHVHVPQGATPKDGPSAGCTIVTALLSLAFGTPVSPDLAMTGELSLSGRMLPIGGVKEKTLAAKRSGVKTIIFPDSNQRDWNELSEELREGITAHFVSHYIDVFRIAFPSLAEEHASMLELLEKQRP